MPDKTRLVRLMFQDEARFGRINFPGKCWAPYPIRPIVKSAIVREYTYVYAAISPVDGHMDSLILPDMTTSSMNIFLKEISLRYKDEYIIMILDGACSHSTKALDGIDNIYLITLPPCSPELNPTEHIWDDLREKEFINKIFASMDKLEDHLENSLIKFEKGMENIKSITNWNWISNINLIAI